MATKRKTKNGTLDIASFEDSTRQLESLIKILEDEGTSIEQALQAFEEGIRITRGLQKSLQEAEQKVTLLLQKNDDMEIADFEPPGETE
jgi:exodeoxyribonuclease VII small subunit